MYIRYDKLWQLMKANNISKTELVKASGISTNVMAKMGKNEPVRLEALTKLCEYFDCTFDDIIEIIKNKETQ